jgi:hypothetical protein
VGFLGQDINLSGRVFACRLHCIRPNTGQKTGGAAR